ncbi:MAG: hypothetical protein ACRDXD_03445 [Acidimicrobiia bacterium]
MGLALAAGGWLALIGRQGNLALARAFYLSQVGKYIPGGIWQAVGQVGLAREAGVPLGKAALAYPVHALVQAAAGAAVGAGLALTPGVSTPIRWGALLLSALLILLNRPWMVAVVSLIERRRPLVRSAELPDQRAILAAFGWSVASMLAFGGGFAALLGSTDRPLAGIPAFAFAWTVGFLAVPFPAGLGIREVALIAARIAPVGPLVAASAVLRVVLIVCEALLILATSLRPRPRTAQLDRGADP